jgi:hypothetical protein
VDQRPILDHYGTGVELDRLIAGGSRIEFERTKELLSRFLPDPPASVVDVGGGPGRYAAWLTPQGCDVEPSVLGVSSHLLAVAHRPS